MPVSSVACLHVCFGRHLCLCLYSLCADLHLCYVFLYVACMIRCVPVYVPMASCLITSIQGVSNMPESFPTLFNLSASYIFTCMCMYIDVCNIHTYTSLLSGNWSMNCTPCPMWCLTVSPCENKHSYTSECCS